MYTYMYVCAWLCALNVFTQREDNTSVSKKIIYVTHVCFK